MRMHLLTSLVLATLLVGINGGGQPRVRLGDTTLIGQRLGPSNLEFFGGPIILSLIMFQSSVTHPLAFRYPFRRASRRRPSLFSSEAQTFPLPLAIIRCP